MEDRLVRVAPVGVEAGLHLDAEAHLAANAEHAPDQAMLRAAVPDWTA